MNELGRERLREAAIKNVRQIKFKSFDDDGGYCATGWLAYVNGEMSWTWHQYDLYGRIDGCPECKAKTRSYEDGFGTIIIDSELQLMVHYNNEHGYDWLQIAKAMPVTDDPLKV